MAPVIARPWTSQPQGAVTLTSGALAGSVVAWEIGPNPRWTDVNGLIWSGVPDGMAKNRVAASSQYSTFSVPGGLALPLTLLWRGYIRAAGTFSLMSIGAASGGMRHLLYSSTSDILLFSGAGGTTGQAFYTGGTTASLNKLVTIVGRIPNASLRELFVDGLPIGTNNTTTVNTTAGNTIATGAYWNDGAPTAGFYGSHDQTFAAVFNRALSDIEILSLAQSPWQLFQPLRTTLWVPPDAAGPVTHASSGALMSDSAIVAGTALHSVPHPSSGALSAGSAVVAGTAAHVALHPSSGALTAGSAVVAGTATVTPSGVVAHPSSGALTADAATVSGTAAHVALHPSSGALTAGSAVVAGTAAHVAIHASSGALTADNAVVAGTAINGVARKNKGFSPRQEAMRRLMIQSEEDVLTLLSTIMASGVLEEVD